MFISSVYYSYLTHLTLFSRSQHLQLIDVERHSKICMNHLETEVQQCNNRFHNLFPTENETQHFRDSCLHVGRSFQNQDRATVRRGTFSEDAATPDVDEFPNSSTTGENKRWFTQRVI